MTANVATGRREFEEEPPSYARFQAVYDEHCGFVARTLRCFGIPSAGVDDALQEVFVVVFRRLHEYDPSRSFRSWLWGIARHVAATQARTEARQRRREEALGREDLAAQPASPDQELARKQACLLVDTFLAGLPEGHREVFLLAEIEGWSAPEIAGALGVPAGTVYSRLHTARARFAEVNARWRRKEGGA